MPTRNVPASSLPMSELVALLNAGYSGYEVPMHLDEPTFTLMSRLVDTDLARSVVLYDGTQAVALALLALRGERTWIAGMGVIPEARGRGLGMEAMRAVLANARAAAARTVQLEVLERNVYAIRIYEALGFVETRRLVVWQGALAVRPPASGTDEAAPLELDAALDAIDRWTSEPPPWQRARESLAHLPEKPAASGLLRDGALAGAIVHRPTPERISALAIGAAQERRRATLETLLTAMIARHPGIPLRLLNLPADDPAADVLESMGATVEARQIEMRLTV